MPSKDPSRGATPAGLTSVDVEKGSWRYAATINAFFSYDGSFGPDPEEVSGSLKWARRSTESAGRKSELEFARTHVDLDDDLGDPRGSPITYREYSKASEIYNHHSSLTLENPFSDSDSTFQ